MRAATIKPGELLIDLDISIHAAHEGCDHHGSGAQYLFAISIHAAHEGCDSSYEFMVYIWQKFQSTQPMRAATRYDNGIPYISVISIHAAHEGCD